MWGKNLIQIILKIVFNSQKILQQASLKMRLQSSRRQRKTMERPSQYNRVVSFGFPTDPSIKGICWPASIEKEKFSYDLLKHEHTARFDILQDWKCFRQLLSSNTRMKNYQQYWWVLSQKVAWATKHCYRLSTAFKSEVKRDFEFSETYSSPVLVLKLELRLHFILEQILLTFLKILFHCVILIWKSQEKITQILWMLSELIYEFRNARGQEAAKADERCPSWLPPDISVAELN